MLMRTAGGVGYQDLALQTKDWADAANSSLVFYVRRETDNVTLSLEIARYGEVDESPRGLTSHAPFSVSESSGYANPCEFTGGPCYCCTWYCQAAVFFQAYRYDGPEALRILMCAWLTNIFPVENPFIGEGI